MLCCECRHHFEQRSANRYQNDTSDELLPHARIETHQTALAFYKRSRAIACGRLYLCQYTRREILDLRVLFRLALNSEWGILLVVPWVVLKSRRKALGVESYSCHSATTRTEIAEHEHHPCGVVTQGRRASRSARSPRDPLPDLYRSPGGRKKIIPL